MPHTWPPETIRELLTLAKTSGQSRAKLGSETEARLFRYAIYSFRRNHDPIVDALITLDGNEVVVTKRKTTLVSILAPKENQNGTET